MASPKTGVAFADDPPAESGSSRPLLADEVYMPMDHSSSSSPRRPLLKDLSKQNGSMGQASTDVEPDVEEFWDQFQSIPDDSDGAESCAKLFQHTSKVFKVFLYAFIFLFVLAGLFFSRLALIAMAGNIGKYESMLSDNNTFASDKMIQNSANGAAGAISSSNATSTQKPLGFPSEILLQRDGWVYLLLFGVIFPYLWTFVQSLAQVTFGNHPYPSIGGILYTVVMETLHSFGLSVFLWLVLPKLNLLEAFVVFSAVGVVPSILHIFNKREGSNVKKIIIMAVDILACVLQVAGLIILAVLIRQKHDIIWQPIVAGLLLSVPYIENFLSTQACSSVGALQTVANALDVWKSNQRRSRAKQYLLASALKIGLMFGFAFALIKNLSTPQDVLRALSHSFPEWNTAALYTPLIILIVIPFLTFYLAYTSSQLLMQRVCYALPLVIHTPFGVVFSALVVKYAPDILRLHPQITLPHGSLFDSLALVAVGLGACWLSQLWITRHLWFPSNLRLEFARNLFVLPNYCAVHLEQSLAYNRSKDDKVVRRAACKHTKEESEATPSDNTPMIYVCATMWHENKNEMLQMLKSIFRLDEDQATKRNSSKILKEYGDGGANPDYYEFEVHIMFDDAMKRSKGDEWTLNDFVVSFVKTINEAASSLYNTSIVVPAPIKIPTPYGGKLLYTLPGENKMVVHLKDKNKIRHRKRWSQIMYMYYLLGFKNLGGVTLSDDPKQSCDKKQPEAEIFQRMPESAITKSENTFLLALDGDVDFKPQALQLLVDRLKKNRKVGVVCGRIHPIGAGPMVWYQRFEYAIGHWLQKAAEHVLGCVLCAPGCFSLFRGSAIMDDNVMKTYSIDATEARHYVQYDQGEDRWLSTLLLQRGYRVEYVAASDAFTYAPETFKEFFNQRRRWAPSTMANILDLLTSWRQTVKRNSSISMLYILYQLLIFLSSILGPATIILLIAGALEQVLRLDAGWSHVFALTPPVIYIVLCFASAADTQIIVATVFSAIYSLVMIAVMIGSIISIFTDGLLTPSGVFLVVLSAIFILSAILHPQEFLDLIPGLLYYITIPSGYLLLTIYSMVNMNIVSWGTRETTKQAKVEKPTGFLHSLIDKQLQEDSLCNKLGTFLSQCCGSSRQLMEDNSKSLHMVLEKVDRLEREALGKQGNTQVGITYAMPKAQERTQGGSEVVAEVESVKRDDLVNPAWMEERCLRHSPSLSLDESEQEFWSKLIERYLKPIEHDPAREAHIADQLKQMRNNVCFAFFMINALWIAIIYLVQMRLPDIQDKLTVMYVNFGKVQTLTLQPLTLAFLTIFGITLVLQFLAMLWHRWATLRHIMAATELDCSCKKTINTVTEAEEIARELQRTDSTESRAKRRQMSLRERFDRRLTAIGRELEAGDEYGNLPARQWHKGHGGKRPTIQARVKRLTAKPRAFTKAPRLSGDDNASDDV